ncbi:OLC1v1014910C1 [Oldenlandia corymbosa var. corymbosa]|uniref:OLC1v1014910C1 n=1 Tax=Oldenlandia corymbosa var. corymbosa TaxID=529605 RepID=A0AAV1E5P3_OLDCO|nr:OLC1v1014910C1 [Oldenlandia corymbosa var. corymbosa]
MPSNSLPSSYTATQSLSEIKMREEGFQKMVTLSLHIPPPPPSEADTTSSPAAESGPTSRGVSLYVGDLHPKVKEADLRQAFETVGPLSSLRLCRDRATGDSLCYAYVNFCSPDDASRALSSLNHTKLGGKAMRIMWSQRDPITRKNGVANLYVKNLSPSISSAGLEELFSAYGTVLSCKIAEENGVSKGFGFVQFDSEDSAIAALNALNGFVFEGKKLLVCKFVRKNGRKDASDEEFTNLYFKNVDEDVSEDSLKGKFSEHGTVSNLVIMKDNEGKSKGFGFVSFSSHEEAKSAVDCLNGTPLGSKTLFVGKAQKKAEREKILQQAHESLRRNISGSSNNSNLFVKNLHDSLDDIDLKALFSSFGYVTSAKVMKYEGGVSKGYGFVHFSCPEEAKRALYSSNGSTIRGKTLFVDFAQSQEERRQHLQGLPVPYPIQSFYPSYWNIHLAPQHHPLCYNAPFPQLPYPQFSLPQMNSLQPKLYEGSSQGFIRVSPIQDQGYLQMLPGTAVPCRQPHQEPKLDMTHQSHPKKSSSSSGWNQWKRLSKQDKKRSAYRDLGSSTTRSGSGNPPTRSSLQFVYRNNFDKMLQPRTKNTQQIFASKNTTEVIVEMDVKKLLNSRNPLAVPVEEAIQKIGATSGSQTTTY